MFPVTDCVTTERVSVLPQPVTRSPYTGIGLGKSLPGLLKAC